MDNKTFSIKDFVKNRPLSWSAISSFKFDPEQWYRAYYLGERQSSKEMDFGSVFAKSCENKKPLAPVTLLSKMEQKFLVVYNGIPLTGFCDTFDDVTKKKIGEYKTGKKIWDQKRVDEHDQITLYALMNYITNKVRPEDCEFFLEWVPTCEHGDFTIDFVRPIKVHHFKTKRTMLDIAKFAGSLEDIIYKMQAHVREHA